MDVPRAAPPVRIDRDAVLRLEVRRLLLRGLAAVGVLVALGWTLAFDPSTDPGWLRDVAVGEGAAARAVVLLAGGAALGALAGVLLAVAVLRPRTRRG